jgi:hypothetical protein
VIELAIVDRELSDDELGLVAGGAGVISGSIGYAPAPPAEWCDSDLYAGRMLPGIRRT